MSEILSLPVLPLDDSVVLPTMVVPVEISDAEVRAAVEAARVSASGEAGDAGPRLLLGPRIGGEDSPVRAPGVGWESRPPPGGGAGGGSRGPLGGGGGARGGGGGAGRWGGG